MGYESGVATLGKGGEVETPSRDVYRGGVTGPGLEPKILRSLGKMVPQKETVYKQHPRE